MRKNPLLLDKLTRAREAVFGFCLRLSRNRELAEDITQETYVKALENLHALQDEAKLESWCLTIAKNLFLAQLRRHQPRPVAEPIAESEETPPSAHDVHHFLSRLSVESRELVTLVWVKGYSHREAAEFLNCSPHAVRCRLYRIRRRYLEIA